MSVIDISISFQVAILSIATPLLLQVILNLDQKYNSQYIIKLFKKESELIAFVSCLFASLILTGFYVFYNSYSEDIYTVPIFIVNTVSWGIPILTAFLIVALLLFIRKILIYYEPNRFLKFSLDKDIDKDEDLFYAFSDVFYYSIREKNDSLIKEIKDEIALLFQKQSKNSSNSLIKYPENYYEFVERSVGELSINSNRWFKFLEYKTAGVEWYLDDYNKGIHEETYASFWKILIIALESNRDDLANHMWHNLHSYAGYNLRELHYDYDYQNLDQGPINAKEVDQRKKHRNRLIEFTNALGGLALYLKKYELINEMFTYTNQEPPKYELIPDTVDDIFNIYFKFKDPHSLNFPAIRARYYFPGKSGISGENIVKEWICIYAALLFLRKYYMKTAENSLFPNIPVDQAEKRNWLNLLHDFRKKVEEVQENKNLLTALGFGNLDEDGLLNTDEFFVKLENKINEAFEREELEQDISHDKINKFLITTGRILTKTINQFSSVCNSNEINGDYERYITEDLPFLWQRSSFLDNVDADHLNFDSILADKQSQIIKDTVVNTFHFNNSTSYIIEIDSLFKAVDAIVSDISEDEFIIVNAGVYLGWYLNQVEVDGLTENSYKKISIINLKHFTKLTGRSLYILRKSDLPYLNHIGPEEKLKKKFRLERIGDNVNYQLYASIIDLKGNNDLKEELKDVRNELDKFVYVYIFSGLEIRWKNDIELIELRQYSEFRGDTNLTPIEEIVEMSVNT